MRSDLAEYLLRRLHEDEEAVQLLQEQSFAMEFLTDSVQTSCEAVRRVVLRAMEVHDPKLDEEYQRFVLPALSMRYADRPDYRPEWRSAIGELTSRQR